MDIIAVVGFSGSGKDTFSDHLVKNHGYKKIAFSDKLKDIVSLLFNWDRQALSGTTLEGRKWRENVDHHWTKLLKDSPLFYNKQIAPENNEENNDVKVDITPRLILQKFGTELFRDKVHQYFWVYCLISSLEPGNKYVISDCRFLQEANTLKDMGCKIFRIIRDSATPSPDQLENLHISEKEHLLIKEDYVLTNNNTMDELYKQIDLLF
ncbi:deoxynucleoside monophosphate kinase [Orpheovirus IHUMI-LCC2]|uniref:Deoxynucleoside monophosphate kinase n=1 Tax=Orpheovirus IHUMI-LCC2 TaxID=2023057 RepID=A0A2I2L3G9_9VIRU|nr:deoxynucleoside monophosphate kinase [Orpheovirus IHUMI-LCC2]SNW62076.1 Putative deoxynucleoside monophosphate kinase [Orpheovirus IHUMI-LCC2]